MGFASRLGRVLGPGALLAATACHALSGNRTPLEPALLPANAPATDIAPNAVADSLLVDLASMAPAPVVDLRYATPNNFTGAPLPGYLANRAFLRREAAAAFARASVLLAAQGYRLEVWDAYRPVRATLAMVRWTQRTRRTDLLRNGYIAERSRHNLGLAVDCTLISDRTGREVPMGTLFDTFSDSAHTMSASGNVLENRLILRRAMERAGFTPYDAEWWHFALPVPNAPRFDREIR